MPDPAGEITICNLALLRIGSTQTITSFSDGSNEARVMDMLYDNCRDELLRKFPWEFAKTYAVLTQQNAAGTRANFEWAYSYRTPSDCLTIRRLFPTIANATVNGVPLTTITPAYASYSEAWRREDGQPNPWPFSTGSDSVGRLIFTDLYAANARYTRQVTDTTLFPPEFSDLLTWRIAEDASYGLAISDSRREWAHKQYLKSENDAWAQTLNEAQLDNPNIAYQAEAVRARFNS
jgi:hypothetical protein